MEKSDKRILADLLNKVEQSLESDDPDSVLASFEEVEKTKIGALDPSEEQPPESEHDLSKTQIRPTQEKQGIGMTSHPLFLLFWTILFLMGGLALSWFFLI